MGEESTVQREQPSESPEGLQAAILTRTAGLFAQPATLLRPAAVVAAVAVAGRTALRIAGNIPFEPVVLPAVIDQSVAALTLLAVTAALGIAAIAVSRPLSTVGFLFVAVFGALGAAAPAAALPALVGVSLGGAIALGDLLEWPATATTARRVFTVGLAVGGVAVSLSSALGLVAGSLHTAGIGATLVALTLVGIDADPDATTVAGGVAVAVLLLAAGVLAPFATGATLLVGFAVTGISLPVVAVGIAGGSLALIEGIRRHEPLLAAGGGLCVCAGIPATPERAATLLLGVALVVGRDALATPTQGVGR